MRLRAMLTAVVASTAAVALAPAAHAADGDPGGLYAPFPEPSSREDALEIFGPSSAPEVRAGRRRFEAAARAGGGPASARAGLGGETPVSLLGPLLLVGVAVACHWLARRRSRAPGPVRP